MRRLSLIACLLALPLLAWAALPLMSEGAPSAAQLQQKIDATRAKIARKRGVEGVLTTDITRWSQRIRRIQSNITGLQRRESRVQADLDAKRNELIRIQEQLRSERARLARLRARLADARVTLSQRLVAIYKSDKPDLISVVLDSHGFADLIDRTEYLHRIGQQDKRIITLVRTAKADATSTAARLDKLETRQQQVTTIILRRRNQIAAVKGQLIDRRVGFAKTRQGKAHALASVRTDRQHLQKHLDDLEAANQRITGQLRGLQGGGGLPAGPIKRGSGMLIWPVNGPITSPFCERRAWEACHPGIDIGVPSGTPIRAAAAGKVILMQGTGSSGGYGNFTCIQHTSVMSTCYAHQQRFATSVGASVSQGQVIGYSDCTGRCFGPHLHFEVRINGSVVNPMSYL
jgi:murein DD-endopeptidase MepM/ murein hydrolase activator NlpD